MAWYWIVLIVLGYLVMWISSAIAHYDLYKDDSTHDAILSGVSGFFWPILLVLVLVRLPFVLVGQLAKFLNKKYDTE